MIYYNFPYRGAFEYDKSVLIILSYCNEAAYLVEQLRNEQKSLLKEIRNIDKELEDIIVKDRSSELSQIIEMMR